MELLFSLFACTLLFLQVNEKKTGDTLGTCKSLMGKLSKVLESLL